MRDEDLLFEDLSHGEYDYDPSAHLKHRIISGHNIYRWYDYKTMLGDLHELGLTINEDFDIVLK